MGQSAHSARGPFWIVWGSRGEPFVVGDADKGTTGHRGPYATPREAWEVIDSRGHAARVAEARQLSEDVHDARANSRRD